jgi:hypothetical protein
MAVATGAAVSADGWGTGRSGDFHPSVRFRYPHVSPVWWTALNRFHFRQEEPVKIFNGERGRLDLIA